MKLHYLLLITTIMVSLVLVACTNTGNEPLPTLAVIDTAAASTAEVQIIATDVETEEAATTVEVVETAAPEATTIPISETAEVVEAPASNLPPVDLDNPLPAQSADNAYYIAPTYATVEEGLNLDETPSGFRWLMVTAALGNQSGATVTVEAEDLFLIGDDGVRYPTGRMVERVSPALIGTQLAQGERVYGFALFALPGHVEPHIFEWCPSGVCDGRPLQSFISLQS